MTMMPLNNYVYEHYKPNCKTPFYVGKGTGNRAYSSSGRNVWWKRIVKKYGFKVRIVADKLNEIDALWIENMCIVGWGRADKKEGPLVNFTDGGEGCCGILRTKEFRAKRSGKHNPMYNRSTSGSFQKGRNHRLYGKMSGINSPRFGKTNNKLQKITSSKRHKNTKFIVNVKTGVMRKIKMNATIPHGFKRGVIEHKSVFVWTAIHQQTKRQISGTMKEIIRYLKCDPSSVCQAFYRHGTIKKHHIKRKSIKG